MYIYDHKLSGSASVLNITTRPSQRYSVQLNGFSGTKSGSKSAKLRVGTYWANDFSKGCKHDSTLKYSDDLAHGFARAMAGQGHQWAIDHGSSHASPLDWFSYTDKSGTSYDNSEKIQGVDTVDFAYLVTHSAVTFVDKPAGTDDLYIFRAAFGRNAPAVAADAFKVESSSSNTWEPCIWFNNKSKLGDKRLRWLAIDSCESVHLPGYVKSEKMNLDVNPKKMWHHAFHGLNMVLGFTGYSSDAWWISDRGFNFGRRVGAGEKIEEAWTDEAYSHWVGDTPVALACGRNEADASHRLRFDRVSGPFVKIPHNEIGAYAWMSRS